MNQEEITMKDRLIETSLDLALVEYRKGKDTFTEYVKENFRDSNIWTVKTEKTHLHHPWDARIPRCPEKGLKQLDVESLNWWGYLRCESIRDLDLHIGGKVCELEGQKILRMSGENFRTSTHAFIAFEIVNILAGNHFWIEEPIPFKRGETLHANFLNPYFGDHGIWVSEEHIFQEAYFDEDYDKRIGCNSYEPKLSFFLYSKGNPGYDAILVSSDCCQKLTTDNPN